MNERTAFSGFGTERECLKLMKLGFSGNCDFRRRVFFLTFSFLVPLNYSDSYYNSRQDKNGSNQNKAHLYFIFL